MARRPRERLLAARIVTPAGIVGPGAVVLDGDRIEAIDAVQGPVPDRTLTPGFVDLQVNGIGRVDVAAATTDADWAALDAALVAQGVTTWLPTLVTAPLGAYDEPLRRIATAESRGSGGRPAIAGVHLEGPFLGGAPGAHPPGLIVPPDLEWLDGLPDIVRLVTIGAEAPGAVQAIEHLAARGVLVSIGHSDATFDVATAAIDAGARLVTHCFNAMSGLHHREPGVVGAALSDDRVAVSVIADLIHVHPAALRVVFAAKPPGCVVLVTDSVAWDAGHVGGIGVGMQSGAPRLPDGTLAGSALTMDRAVANAVEHCGVPLADAVAAASTNPAALLGLADRGRIAPGLRADIVSLDAGLAATETWIGGVRQ